MAIVKIPELRSEQSISEYCVGAALSTIIYPGIAQCISITGWCKYDLLGTHISPGATADDIAETLRLLHAGGSDYTKWYIVGNFVEHGKSTKVGWSSVGAVGKAVKKKLSKNATYLAYDTTTIATAFSWGINIRAAHGADGVAFSTSKYPGTTNPYTAIPPVFVSL